MHTLRRVRRALVVVPLWAVVASLALWGAGCERKEKVLDIEAPGVDIEVERDKE